MNHPSQRQRRRLFPTLTTLVVIFAQIALPPGDLPAAVQPTPQTTPPGAKQTKLDDWHTNTVSALFTRSRLFWSQVASPTVQQV